MVNKTDGDELTNKLLGSAVEGNQYLTFKLKEEEYAISILSVKEIIGIKKITKIPNIPNYIKGVINLRGNIIQVVDLREKFELGLKDYDKFTVIIIIEVKNKLIGILVDQVKDVANIKDEDIQTTISKNVDLDEEYINGIAKVENSLVVILNIENFLKKC